MCRVWGGKSDGNKRKIKVVERISGGKSCEVVKSQRKVRGSEVGCGGANEEYTQESEERATH